MTKIKQLFLLFAFNCSLVNMVYSMEEVYSLSRAPKVRIAYSNNARYAGVGCFSCFVKKVVSPTAQEQAERNSQQLIQAVINNDATDILSFIFHGNTVNQKDDRGLAPLHYAARNVNPRIMHSLLSAPHIDLTSTTPQGLTALRIIELARENATTDQQRERCDACIKRFHECQKRKEAESEWFITKDIGDKHPIADAKGNLWVLKDGIFLMCGTVCPDSQELEKIDI